MTRDNDEKPPFPGITYDNVIFDGALLKRLQETLRESEENYRVTLDCMADAIHLIDANYTIVLANRRFREWMESLGLESKIVGKTVFDVFPFLSDSIREEYGQVFTSGRPIQTEEIHVIKEKTIMTETRKLPVLEAGAVNRVLTVVRDITEQKRAEQALRASEERYRSILDSIQEGYYEVDIEGSFTFFNQAMCRILGYSESEMNGLNFRRYYSPEKAEYTYQIFEEILETGQSVQLEDWEIIKKDGSMVTLSISASPIYNEAGRAVGFRGIARDVTQRRQVELALRESEERYREILENANDIIYTHDLNGVFTSLNKTGERISQYSREEARGVNIADILAPEYREQARLMTARKIAGEDPTRYEVEFFAKDGRRVPVEVSTRIILKDGKPIGIQGIARDISERRKSEEERRRFEAQLQHAQKLEGLGVLAGGIAHDFNNLLVGVLGYAGLALVKLPPESPARSYVERIEATAKRAAELTNQMLAYSGRGTFSIRPLNLNKLTEEMLRLIEASISKKAAIQFHHEPDLPLIKGDAAQLHQVIMNLITNASDAIGENIGTITVATYHVYADRAYLSATYLDDDLPPGEYVCLEVSDTGCGMDAATMAKIFDPFFSTKFAGRGLGLAATLGIIRGHKGAIKVYSELGHGTTFKALLPVAETETGEKGTDSDNVSIDQWQSSGTILIADDEETARDVARDACIAHGFDVITATNGREAIELFRENRKKVTAIILDLMMPIMNGQEAFIRLKAIEPSVPIILSSGYTEQDATTRIGGINPTGFVQKPYSLQEFARKLKMVLA